MVVDEAEGQRVLEAAKRKKLSRGQKRALSTVSVASVEEHQQTVVDSADGAKVIQNLENLANNSENLSIREKNDFIGDLQGC